LRHIEQGGGGGPHVPALSRPVSILIPEKSLTAGTGFVKSAAITRKDYMAAAGKMMIVDMTQIGKNEADRRGT